MATTSHYGLNRIRAGDSLSDSSFKYSDRDREFMSLLLWLGAEGHHHTGAVAATGGTPAAPYVSYSTNGGSLPAGARVYYRYTQIETDGQEGLPSTEAYVDLPTAVAEPGAPVLSLVAGGSLNPGNYWYAVSAYTTSTTYETKALSSAYLTVRGTTNRTVHLVFPTPPTGTTGWNIYRKSPGGGTFGFLATVPVATTTYDDTGSVPLDAYRQMPKVNTTYGTNSVTVTIPTTSPQRSWKIYRTMVSGQYPNSLLHQVVEQTAEGSGIITAHYTDLGLATTFGEPPAAEQHTGSPAKISLADGAEVSGTLPLAAVSAFPHVVEFSFVGSLTGAVVGTNTWVCEFPRASIVGVRATLGRGYAPAAQPVVVDVQVGHGANPTMASIFTSSANQPRVVVGSQVGLRVVPTARTEIVEGDVLTCNIDQVGLGATPTDRDLTISISLLVYGYTAATSFTHPTALFTPAQLPLIAWYKADSLGLSDAAAVASWADSSGNGRPALQSNAALQPTCRNGVLNSLPVVLFDGVNDYLRTSTFSAVNKPITVIGVVKNVFAYAAADEDFIDGDAASSMRVAKRLNTQGYLIAGSYSVAVVEVPDTAFHIIAATFDGTSSTASNLRIGGGAGTVGNAGTTPITAITLGASGGTPTEFLYGYEAEVIVVQGPLDLADLNALGSYLATKYALTWTTAT